MTPPAFPTGEGEAMDKQENRATGAGGVVLSAEVVNGVVTGFEYLVVAGVQIPDTIDFRLVLDELWKVRDLAKGGPVRVVPE
jgi:hypothetical protein